MSDFDFDSNVFPLRKWPSDTRLLGYASGSRSIVAYCAEEVRRQQDTPWHVYRMYNAWMFAMDNYYSKTLTHSLVREFASLIDEENAGGYRTQYIWVGGDKRGYIDIHANMDTLLSMQNTVSPGVFYLQFELIHPFMDGNGRTGKILYNWLNGTLSDPVWPPDYFGGIENP